MPSKGDKRRLAIFNTYAKNLELWRPEFSGKYICPLCLTAMFDEGAIIGPDPMLTEEHCIPDSVASTPRVLTCKDCNNNAGSKVDHHLKKKLLWDGFCDGSQVEAMEIQLMIDGKRLGATIRRGEKEERPYIDIQVTKGQCNESDLHAIESRMKAMVKNRILPPPFQLMFGPKCMPSRRGSHLALLKAAYLLAFHRLGYGYILCPALDPIRQTIVATDDPTVDLDSIILKVGLENVPSRVGMITSPKELEALFAPVVMPKYGMAYIVGLPNNISTYSRWSQWRKDHARDQSMTLRFELFRNDGSTLTHSFLGWSPPRGIDPDHLTPSAAFD